MTGEAPGLLAPAQRGRQRLPRRPPGLQRGCVGLLLLFGGLAGLHAVTIPPFLPADEPAHYGYAMTLARGELPTIDSPIPVSSSAALRARLESETDADKRDVWTANHPPLHPALVAAPIAWGERTGRPFAGLLAARSVGVFAGGASLLGVAWLATQLVPGRPRTALLAAALVGTVPLVAHVSAFMYNDALALAAVTLTLAAAAAAVRRGRSPALVAAVAAAASAAALTRVSGLIAAAVGVAALAWAGGAPILPPGAASPGAGVRIRGALAAAAPAVIAVAATSGWFYLRNLARYGDLTGAAALFEKFERTPDPAGLGAIVTAGYWKGQAEQLWNGFAGATGALGPQWIRLAWVVGAVMLIGVIVALATALAGHTARRPTPGSLAPWVPPVAAAVLLALSIGGFVAGGGGSHPRYWLALLPLLAVVVAIGLQALPGHRWVAVPLTVVTAQVGIGLLAWGRFSAHHYPQASGASPWALAHDVLALAGTPSPGAAMAALGACIAAGLALLTWGLLRLPRSEAEPGALATAE